MHGPRPTRFVVMVAGIAAMCALLTARLQRTGVGLAIGSDEYDDTSVREARYLEALGILDRAAVLRAWCETGPRTIFPGRRIGRLLPGSELR